MQREGAGGWGEAKERMAGFQNKDKTKTLPVACQCLQGIRTPVTETPLTPLSCGSIFCGSLSCDLALKPLLLQSAYRKPAGEILVLSRVAMKGKLD